MWVPFQPVKDWKKLIKVAEKLMKIKPVRIERVSEGWRLSIKLDGEVA